MPVDAQIRQATAADALELAQLRWDDALEEGITAGQSFEAFRDQFVAFIQQALAHGRWAIWVGEANRRIISQVYVQLIDKVPRPGRSVDSPVSRWGYVTAVYTVPELRNQGIGSRVLARVLDWGREQQLDVVLVWPSQRSVSFYERAGFVQSPEALELAIASGSCGRPE